MSSGEDRDTATKFIMTFEVNAAREPELAAFIRSIPYGRRSRAIREVLSTAAKFNAYRKDDKPASRVSTKDTQKPVHSRQYVTQNARDIEDEVSSFSKSAADAMLMIGDQF